MSLGANSWKRTSFEQRHRERETNRFVAHSSAPVLCGRAFEPLFNVVPFTVAASNEPQTVLRRGGRQVETYHGRQCCRDGSEQSVPSYFGLAIDFADDVLEWSPRWGNLLWS